MELPCKASARPSGATGVLCLPQGRLRTCTGGGGRAKTANPGTDGAAPPSEPWPAQKILFWTVRNLWITVHYWIQTYQRHVLYLIWHILYIFTFFVCYFVFINNVWALLERAWKLRIRLPTNADFFYCFPNGNKELKLTNSIESLHFNWAECVGIKRERDMKLKPTFTSKKQRGGAMDGQRRMGNLS